MKALIDGLLYDTETAEFLGEIEDNVGDRDGYLGKIREKYYRTPNGRYFIERQYRWARMFCGHRDWEAPSLREMDRDRAKQLKLEGKLKDDGLIIEAA